jgi:hypothetical protein
MKLSEGIGQACQQKNAARKAAYHTWGVRPAFAGRAGQPIFNPLYMSGVT